MAMRKFVADEDFIAAPVKSPVSYDVVEQLDIRVGRIISVEDVPTSKKLLRLRVGFGDHERTVISGMKGERDNHDEIVGEQALFVVNLEPRVMAGERSEAMILDIGYADGLLPALAQPERSLPDGARAG
ncbi:hypothetical protein [Nocardia alni]|uniref:hypothetical protein n=1 Tax=Nocardia alni TaxID=2815723 RepID=UPI001C23B81B|nr:hypothetical protein [Nocardia alni]